MWAPHPRCDDDGTPVPEEDAMIALIVCESLYGTDLLIVGGPTQIRGLSTALSRRMGVSAGVKEGHAEVEPRGRRCARPARMAARSARRTRAQGGGLPHPANRIFQTDRFRGTRNRAAPVIPAQPSEPQETVVVAPGDQSDDDAGTVLVSTSRASNVYVPATDGVKLAERAVVPDCHCTHPVAPGGR
jgi:hypothetical protein